MRIGQSIGFSLFLLLLLVAPFRLQATHIVGGEMNYTCLGNNEYEITLTIFRDCFNGNPNAWFDDPASIGIFSADNELLDEIRIDLMGNDTLNPVLTNECLVVPPSVCVHTTTYRAIVELEPRPGGYQLAYQRCCRNQTIANIVAPLETGATYGVTISEKALEACNSSPKFKDWPPIYICANEPIVFDQSAIDPDGDSIVYRLCTPLAGADQDIPMPQPPNNPPYEEIVWDEDYGVDNMLNGNPGGVPLQIDSETGLLTGLPNTIGQFVVGICAEEYRNGELISTTRRDFQYNVGVCGEPTAAFAAPEVQCGDLTVSFDNQSNGVGSYLWKFNDPGNPGAASVLSDPVYTFSDTGTYEVQLIAVPGEVCADTFTQEIRLQPNSLSVDFDIDQETCSDSLEVQFTDQSADNLADITSWSWTVSPAGFSSELQNPSFFFTESGEYTAELSIVNTNGCESTASKVFDLTLLQDVLPSDTLVLCPGNSITLNPEPNPNYNYTWSEAPEISDLNDPSPVVAPGSTTTYEVTVADTEGFCEVKRQLTVFVPPAITAKAPPDTTICEPTYQLEGESNTGTSFLWSLDPSFETIVGESNPVTVELIGEERYYFLARDSFGCIAIDSTTLLSNAVDVVFAADEAICPGSLAGVTALNQDSTDELSFDWGPDPLIIFGGESPTVFFELPEPGTFEVFASIENQLSCSLLDTLSLTLIDTLPQEDFVAAQQCGGYTVEFSSSSVNAPFYLWRFGDPEDPNAVATGAEASHTYSSPGTYEVQITHSAFLACKDTIVREITVEEPQIIPGFEYETIGCSDTLLVEFADTSVNTQSEIIDWQWDFGNGLSATGPSSTLTILEDQPLPVTLTIRTSDGCVEQVTQEISWQIPNPQLPDSLAVCPGEAVALNPDPLPGYTHTWSPDAFFDNPNAPNPTVQPEQDQTFDLLLEQQDGPCAFERSVSVQVAPPISYEKSPDTLICGNTVRLGAFSPAAAEYAWSLSPDFGSLLATGDSLEANVSGLQTFYLELTDTFGCRTKDSIRVEASEILVFTDPFIGICEGDSARLEVVEIPEEQELFYDWAPDSRILEGQGTNEVLVQADSDQAFTVFITNEQGCTTTEKIEVFIEQSTPPLEVSAEQDTVFAPQEVQLFSTAAPGYSYEWSPAQGLSNPFVSNPRAMVDSTITYSLSITDENGCSNQALLTLTFLGECLPPYIFVPNAFTPNGDALNDELRVEGQTIEELYFAIYDRWGEMVFETNEQSRAWDGTFRGRELAPDVYGYYLEARCFNGETYFEKGNITLIR